MGGTYGYNVGLKLRNVRGRYIRIPHLFEVDLSGDKLVVKQ